MSRRPASAMSSAASAQTAFAEPRQPTHADARLLQSNMIAGTISKAFGLTARGWR